MLAHRGKSKPRQNRKLKALLATAPNEVWSWDITYLQSCIKGQFYYLYMIEDIFSRGIVGWEVHDQELSELSSTLMEKTVQEQGISKNQLTLHADNGGPMKGATMLGTLQTLGVMPSFSRPSVSNDNAFSESTFKTVKYCPMYPDKPFASLEEARQWAGKFVDWYNNHHRHSGIKFVTPMQRHRGLDADILTKRKTVYEQAKANNPLRWSGRTRDWSRINLVELNNFKRETRGAA